MRLIELPRTSAFRNSIRLLTLLGAASAGILVVAAIRTTDHLVGRVDHTLRLQRDELSAMDGPALQRFVELHDRYDVDHRWETVLYDSDGTRVAGGALERPASPRASGRPFSFQGRIGHTEAAYRGLMVSLPGGEELLISERVGWVSLFDRSILLTSLAAGIAVAAIGFVGTTMVGFASLRQINAMSRATEAIMTGDLSRRLPTGRGSGDIDRMASIVNAMLDEIERLMHEVEAVTDGIAHDLRTPLTRLLAGLERTQRRAQTTQEYAHGLDNAMGEVQRLLEIFGAMMRLAELERSKRQAGFEEVGLRSVAESVVDFLEPVAEAKGIGLSLTGPEVTFWADRSLMFEALSNLVDNAIKFTPDQGTVAVEVVAQPEPGYVVRDNGTGIPAHERSAVLRRFYRLDESRHVAGNGLGLSLVAAIGTLHGMVIQIDEANPGASNPGACVSLRRAPEGTASGG